MTRRAPSIVEVSPSGDDVEIRWEVDSFFADSEAPEKVLVTINGQPFAELDADETSVAIPAARIAGLGTALVTVGIIFWWGGSPPEEQHSVYQFTVAGPATGGVYPAATPRVTVVSSVPRTTRHPASITIAWQSNNYNDGNIVWGPQSQPDAFRRSIRPRGERYSGQFTTDRSLAAGTRYLFRVEVRNTLHSPGWLSSTIAVTCAEATWSVRTFLERSGEPITAGIASLVGPARSVRAWLRG